MSSTKDYSITTISASLGQYGAVQAPFRQGPVGTPAMRFNPYPYWSAEGNASPQDSDITKDPWELPFLTTGSWSSCPKMGNYAISFTGSDTTYPYDRINRVEITNTDNIFTSPNFTVALWIKPYVWQDSGGSVDYTSVIICCSKSTSGTPYTGWTISGGDDGVYVSFPFGNWLAIIAGDPADNGMPLNTWHHLALTIDSTGSNSPRARGFVNGTRVAQSTAAITISTPSPAEPLMIGGIQGGISPTKYMKMSVDEIAYWDTPLSDQAINTLYNSGSGLDARTLSDYEVRLQGYWRCEGGPTSGSLSGSTAQNHKGQLLCMKHGTRGLWTFDNPPQVSKSC